MSIHVVIFDYGAVLCHPPSHAEVAEFASLAHIPAADFRHAYITPRAAYDRGTLSSAEYWQRVGAIAGLTYTDAQLRALAAMDIRVWSRIDPRMIQLSAALRAAGIRTAILSNMHPDLREIFRTQADWLRHFDLPVFSCDIGLVKPEPAIYHYILNALRIQPAQAFFIDDLPANIEAARSLGIDGMVHRSFEELSLRLTPLLASRTGEAIP